MARVAFVTFDGFYAASLARSRPELAGRPVAVLRDRAVLDASIQARRYGIHPGLRAAEARYAGRGRAQEPVFVDYRREDYAAASRRFLDACAEYASAVEPVDDHAAFLDLGRLPHARDDAMRIVADIFHACGVCPRVGIASSKLVARIAAARSQGHAEVVAEGGDSNYLSPVSIEHLWLAEPEALQRLKRLGIRTCGEAAALDSALLRRHFGDEGARIRLWAQGSDPTRVLPLYPPDEVRAAFHFPQPARLDAEMEPALLSLAQTLSESLREKNLAANEVELETHFEDGTVRGAKRAFTRPMQSLGALLTGLRLTLRRISIEQGISALYVRLEDVRPAGQAQRALRDDESANGCEQALLRLKKVFGSEAIKTAAQMEPQRRDLLLRAWRDSTGWGG